MKKIIFAVILLIFSVPVFAQSKDVTVKFAKGKSGKIYKGVLVGDETKDYLVTVRAGQKISVKIDSESKYVNLFALLKGEDFITNNVNEFEYEAKKSGKYIVRVYTFSKVPLNKKAIAGYSLKISVN